MLISRDAAAEESIEWANSLKMDRRILTNFKHFITFANYDSTYSAGTDYIYITCDSAGNILRQTVAP